MVLISGPSPPQYSLSKWVCHPEVCVDTVTIISWQFSGTIETVALLLDKNIEYPPRVKRYEVDYDWKNKMAKVAVTAGEEWDEYIMRYDQVARL